MEPLSREDHRVVTRLSLALGRGESLTQRQMDVLTQEWTLKARPDAKDQSERFAVVRPDGVSTGVVGPRWVFHLFGLRHRAVEIALRTQTGLIVLQRRSPTKEDWPDAPDMAVAGHLPQNADGSDLSWEEGAWKEITEEIGLDKQDAQATLAEGRLIPVGEPYLSYDADPARNPPFYNAEARQIFAATLTGAGLARLRFPDAEAAGLFLVTPETAWRMLAQEQIASGMRYTLPRYLDWLEKQRG
jgi:isopentenyldiphosphate isomerase